MNTYYMSFVDNDRPEGNRWLGACIINADSVQNAVEKAWIAGCNPGGEILMETVTNVPDEKWFCRLLNREDLRQMSDETVAKYNLPSEMNSFHNGSGQKIEI